MRRRTLLRAGAATACALAAVPARAASASQSAFAPLGSLEIDGLVEVVVDPSGTVVFGALRDGFVVVDIADPEAPTELARVEEILPDVEDGPVTDIFDVKLSGDRLLVMGPNHGPGDDDAAGFEVYDVAEHADPQLVAGRATDHAIHNGFIDGETVYLGGTGAPREPLVIYDVAGGEPRELSRWSVEDAEPAWADVAGQYRPCHDVFVQDDVAYLAYWDAGTWLLDVSDPMAPSPIAGIAGLDPEPLPAEIEGELEPGVRELPGNSHYARPSPDGAVLAVGKEAGNDDRTALDGGPGGIELWALEDRTSPELLALIAPPVPGETSHNFGWRGRRLYTSWYGGGVAVYDLAEPTSPRQLAGWADQETTSFWTAQPISDGFVASSFLDPAVDDREKRVDGVGAALYTFPEPAAGASEAAETLTRRPTPTVTTSATPLPITSPTPTAAPSATTTGDSSPSTPTSPPTAATESGPTPTTGPGTTATTSASATQESGPGFGVLSALAGGGLAAWRLLTGRSGDAD